MPSTSIPVQTLDAVACAPYGVMLGKAPPDQAGVPAFLSPSSDFWREHLFDTGAPGATDVLWVRYRNSDPSLTELEAHRLTQQAIVPLTGPIVQILATSMADGSPDLASLRAFLVPVGQGLCMHRNTWHATRVLQGEVAGLMLSRPSTTVDLEAHLLEGTPIAESAIQKVRDYRIG